jgi:hypothetical protein
MGCNRPSRSIRLGFSNGGPGIGGALFAAPARAPGKFARLAAVMLLVAGSSWWCPAVLSADDGELEVIWEQFAKRQKAGSTARFEFSRSTWRAGEVVDDDSGQDLLTDSNHETLLLSGDLVRYESQSVAVRPEDDGEYVSHISAFDGTSQQYFTNAASLSSGVDQASIQQQQAFDEWGNITLRGLFLNVRPLRPEFFGPDTLNWQLRKWPELVNGIECFVLHQTVRELPHEPASLIERVVYLDYARDYVPVRMTEGPPGTAQITLDIVYERGDPPLWIPSSWKTEWHGAVSGKLLERSELMLKDVELGVALPASRFTIDFPADTVLIDRSDGGRKHVVNADGSRRPYGLPREGGGRGIYLFWGLVIIVFTAAGILYWRRSAY